MKSQQFFLCQSCGSEKLYNFIDFGLQPKPNIYLTKEESGEQTTYQLGADLCTNCGLVQLNRDVPANELFAGNYAYRTPEAMRLNFAENVKEAIELSGIDPKKGKVLEVGGGTGVVLQEYQKMGINAVLGVDPAIECVNEANENGVNTIAARFSLDFARKLAKEQGKFDIVTAANVFQHIPELWNTFAAVSAALSDDGLFVLEFPYLGDILNDLAWDTFYAEHYYYLGLQALQRLLNSLNMTIIRAKRLPNVHCGSMRIFVKHMSATGAITESETLKMMQQEVKDGFTGVKAYKEFSKRIDQNMHQLQEHLYVAKERGDRIVAHGASAKFITLTNYGHIGTSIIEYVADNTPAKQGKFTPGMGIPVVSEEKLIEDAPDLIVCGIRNFYEQSKPLYDKVKARNPKCKILIPIPEVVYK